MANFRRRRSSTSGGKRGYNKWVAKKRAAKHGSWCEYMWMHSWPAWWDITFHRRPHRRATSAMEHQIKRGADPDAAQWPLHKRPHNYFW